MKYIAVFLILNVLLLSSVTGMANIPHGTASCCAAKMTKSCCKEQKHSSDNDCAKGNCNAMLSCTTYGFLIISPVSLSPVIIDLILKPLIPLLPASCPTTRIMTGTLRKLNNDRCM
jgi:hypothetical protein